MLHENPRKQEKATQKPQGTSNKQAASPQEMKTILIGVSNSEIKMNFILSLKGLPWGLLKKT